ncbi:secreted RxLR effector protein 161-like [Arachis stenosperma]|uniref:secreted RxLR effector protein 161-like n=1 Tax=Arachis stenosperma TaxID=217475 RepID=UPI0025AC5FF6|nr:secreted RxLR effector protein 161-like [Arachis stenosperma]
MYAQVCTRLDIAFAISMLGRYQSNPGIIHWRATKKVLRYLQGTKDFMLTYRRIDNLKIVGYSDSDLAGLSWKSAKQSLVATSTMEAEFIACFEATSQGVWLKNFIFGLKIMDCISRPLRIYCDNSAAIFMAKNNKSSSRSKHIDIKYLAIKDQVRSNEV